MWTAIRWTWRREAFYFPMNSILMGGLGFLMPNEKAVVVSWWTLLSVREHFNLDLLRTVINKRSGKFEKSVDWLSAKSRSNRVLSIHLPMTQKNIQRTSEKGEKEGEKNKREPGLAKRGLIVPAGGRCHCGAIGNEFTSLLFSNRQTNVHRRIHFKILASSSVFLRSKFSPLDFLFSSVFH